MATRSRSLARLLCAGLLLFVPGLTLGGSNEGGTLILPANPGNARLCDVEAVDRTLRDASVSEGGSGVWFTVHMAGFHKPSEIQADLSGAFKIGLTSAPNLGQTAPIRCEFPGLARVLLAIYDVAGRAVLTMVSGEKAVSPGRYAIEWDGKDEGGVESRAESISHGSMWTDGA